LFYYHNATNSDEKLKYVYLRVWRFILNPAESAQRNVSLRCLKIKAPALKI